MNGLLKLCLATILTLFLMIPSVQADLDFAVKLKTGDFTPDPIKATGLKALATGDNHALVQFEGPVTDDHRARLASQGIELLSYIPNFTYTARIRTSLSQALIDDAGVRWIGSIEPGQKISPMISDQGIGEWARRDGDRVQFAVVLHRDEDAQFWSDYFRSELEAEILGHEPSVNVIELIAPEQALDEFSHLDAVLWIEQALPPQELHNNSCRTNNGAEVLQAAPYGLDGTGVMLGEWDGGRADVDHIDLGNLISGDGSSFHYHATHVAGTVLGAGIGNATYRGMAPGAQMLTYLWWSSASEMSSEYTSAISTWDMSIATNSWGYGVGDPATESSCQSTLGNYYSVDATIDNIIRGSAGEPVTILFSAGNQRGASSQYCGSIGWTFGTIGPTACSKNCITVGAINSNNNSMTSFSSWGPTDDGRVKPDVVGPGCQSSVDWGVTSTQIGGGYQTLCGTSMSTPATAGIVALMREQYNISFGVGTPILPSTLKGIMINTAQDLGNHGPDYVYGHGVVDGVAACTKIAIGAPSYVEDDII
ncbi:MAG: S8 family serine peptidase, partial [candidate division Zixibacteria bacterium]|nr:S8 family serine peptidase [candidate division Zixibacteria bacterium]